MRLSVIVPCYKVEKYLRGCLDSVVAAAVGCDCEIICVNDGSPDNSPAILREYQTRYPGLISVIDQENQGLAVVRNVGCDIAKGDYVAFVDADDTVPPCAFARLLDTAAENGNPDMVLGGCTMVSEQGERTFIPESCYIEGADVPRKVYAEIPSVFTTSTWAKLYNRRFLNRENLRNLPGMIRGQDGEFNLRVWLKCRSLATCPHSVYNYSLNEGISSNFRGDRHIDAIGILAKARLQFPAQIYTGGEELERALEAEQPLTATLFLSLIYTLYYTDGIRGRYRSLRRINSTACRVLPGWTTYLCPLGLSGKVRKIGYRHPWLIHILMMGVRSVPRFRRRLKEIL